MSDIPETTVDQVGDDATYLDVREQDEWDAGHIAGATHIPMGEVPARLGELPEADPLVVVCRSGNRSGRVVEWLNQQGYDTVNLAGGMKDWAAKGRPVAGSNGSAGQVI